MGALPNWRPRDIIDELVKLKNRVKSLETRSPFYGAGVRPNGVGGLDSTTYVPDVSGFSLNGVTGTPEFNDLKLRGGIVGNDALASPVVQGVARNRRTGFGLSNTTFAELAAVDITVPPNCSQALVDLNASFFAYNPNTAGGSDGIGSDAFHIIASIGSQATDDEPLGVSGSGGYTTVRTSDSFVLTGLTPGQTVRLSVYGASAYAPIAANPSNNAKVSAGLSFLR